MFFGFCFFQVEVNSNIPKRVFFPGTENTVTSPAHSRPPLLARIPYCLRASASIKMNCPHCTYHHDYPPRNNECVMCFSPMTSSPSSSALSQIQ